MKISRGNKFPKLFETHFMFFVLERNLIYCNVSTWKFVPNNCKMSFPDFHLQNRSCSSPTVAVIGIQVIGAWPVLWFPFHIFRHYETVQNSHFSSDIRCPQYISTKIYIFFNIRILEDEVWKKRSHVAQHAISELEAFSKHDTYVTFSFEKVLGEFQKLCTF